MGSMAQLLLCSLILIQASANDDILGDYNPGEHHDQSARKAHQKTHGTKLVKFEADTIAALGPGILGGDRALHGSNSDEVGLAVGRGGLLLNSTIPFAMSRGYRLYAAKVPPPWIGQSSCSRKKTLKWLKDAFTEVESVRTTIRRRYSGDSGNKQFETLATKLFGPPSSGASSTASKLEKELEIFTNDVEDRIASRMLLLLLEEHSDRRFTFAFTGHSNAAGHGNYFDHTYPFVMARDLSIAFSHAGLHLAVQNFAVGGTSTIPTTGFCARSAVGDAVDVASWDFAMTEGGGKGQKQGESWIRSMLSLEKRPAAGLLFVDAGGRAKKWASHYRAVGAFHALGKVEKGLPLAANDSRPEALRWLHPDCRKFGENGTPQNTYCRQEKWGPAKYEMRWTSGKRKKLEAAVYDRAGKKVGGSCPGMVAWHDGFKLHQLKGSILAHFYARCLEMALRRLASAVHALPYDASDSDVMKVLQKIREDVELINRRRLLPTPGGDCGATPLCPLIGRLKCVMSTKPHVGSAITGWKDTVDKRRLIQSSLDSFNDRKRKDEETCHMGFLDYKYSVNVDAEDGWVRFELPGMTAEGALMICEPSTGWKRSPTMAQLNSPREVSFRLDSAPLPLRNPSKDSIVEQCFRFAPGSTRGHKDTKDTALYIKAAPGKAARISHIIWEAGNKEPPLG